MKTRKELEAIQDHLLSNYRSKLNAEFEEQKLLVVDWFKESYPKRKVEFIPSQWLPFWEVDGKEIDFNEERYIPILEPLYDFLRAYMEMDETMNTGPDL